MIHFQTARNRSPAPLRAFTPQRIHNPRSLPPHIHKVHQHPARPSTIRGWVHTQIRQLNIREPSIHLIRWQIILNQPPIQRVDAVPRPIIRAPAFENVLAPFQRSQQFPALRMQRQRGHRGPRERSRVRIRVRTRPRPLRLRLENARRPNKQRGRSQHKKHPLPTPPQPARLIVRLVHTLAIDRLGRFLNPLPGLPSGIRPPLRPVIPPRTGYYRPPQGPVV